MVNTQLFQTLTGALPETDARSHERLAVPCRACFDVALRMQVELQPFEGALAQKGAPLPKMIDMPAAWVAPGAAGKLVDEHG